MRGRDATSDAEHNYLVVECGHFLFAFHSMRVVRAVLNEGVSVVKSTHDPTRPGEKPRCPPVAVFGDFTWVAWDMGLIVKQESAPKSWLLFKVPYGEHTLQMGLRVGTCLSVGAIPRRTHLPQGIFGKRGAAFRSGFVVDDESAIGRSHKGRLGVVVEERKLWTPAELQVSAASLGLEPLREGGWV